jgi:hypothetical protein
MKKILKLGFLIAFLSIFIVGCNKHEVKPYDYTAFKKSKPYDVSIESCQPEGFSSKKNYPLRVDSLIFTSYEGNNCLIIPKLL